MFDLLGTLKEKEQRVIDKAIAILDKRASKPRKSLKYSDYAHEYFRLRLSTLDREHFAVAYLDEALNLIRCDIEFAGSINEVPIKPLEIARKALTLSATRVILAHNHPSGVLKASDGDIHATKGIQKVLTPFEIEVCDHIIVTTGGSLSFVDEGLL